MKTFYNLDQKDKVDMIIPEINKRIIQAHFSSNPIKEETYDIKNYYLDLDLKKKNLTHNKKN